MRVLSTVRFTLLRMLRNYIVLLLLLIVPIVLISLFSLILSGAVTDTGEPYLKQPAVSLVLCFQLFGGSTVMYMIHSELFTEHRARMQMLPISLTMYAFSIMLCGVVYSVMLGVILMTFTQFVLGVIWEHWLWTIYLITLMAILSSVVYLVFMLAVKVYKTAERLSEVYGIGFILLAGLFFPMPDHAFFRFMGSYGNPLTLSTIAIHEMSMNNTSKAWFAANILLAATIILFLVMMVVGRRRFMRDRV